MINKTTAKQRTLLVLLSALLFAAQCGKKEADAPQADVDLRYARYAIALYSKAGSTAKGDYVTTLTKTEKVEVEFPVGHPRRRAEGIPLLLAKAEENFKSHYDAAKTGEIMALMADQQKLEGLKVTDFMAALV